MTRRHDDVFDAVLSGLDEDKPQEARASARFLRRQNTMAEQASGERQEKVLRLVDPATCRMWTYHNRAYDLLNEENCRDLIDGIRAQGGQEFPAIVRRLPEGGDYEFEVICGARRHFAISWLRANNYPQFRYLIEERDLTEEEAFRLADIENREREDLSDYERARDYLGALDRFYGGKQKAMAERLEISQTYLSRLLDLARLPDEIVAAFGSIRDLRELHARKLKPLLADDSRRDEVLRAAVALKGQGADAAQVLRMLSVAGAPPPVRAEPSSLGQGVTMRRKGRKTVLEFDSVIDGKVLRDAINSYLKMR